MYQDEIIAEVWGNRDAYAALHHHSLAEMVADLRARQNRADRILIDRRDTTKHSGRDYTAERESLFQMSRGTVPGF
jgi:hypothetical protein